VAFFLALGALWRVSRSPFGMALRAIRDNDVRAAFVGIPVRAYRWRAFVLSGAITGLAGGLYGQLDRQVTPEQLGWLFSAKLVVATIIGGTQWFLGAGRGRRRLRGLQHCSSSRSVYQALASSRRPTKASARARLRRIHCPWRRLESHAPKGCSDQDTDRERHGAAHAVLKGPRDDVHDSARQCHDRESELGGGGGDVDRKVEQSCETGTWMTPPPIPRTLEK
jgi:Branched-chain amino acid transport system / permease component